MMDTNPRLTLDPVQMTALGDDAVRAVVDHYISLPDRPIGATSTATELGDILHEPLPAQGDDPHKVLDVVRERVLSQIVAQDHPRYFATVPSASNFVAVVADTLASGFNVFAGNWAEGSGPAAVELAALRWLREMCGLPEGGGLFTTGGSMANLTALATARYNRLGDRGLARGTLYVTEQSHSCFIRSARILGMEPEQLRMVPTREDLTMDVAALREMLRADRAEGWRPFCVVANVGTTRTAAVDPLPELARVCREEEIWLHGDGAFGAAAAIIPEGRRALSGIEELDSLSIDPHKWWFQPFEIGGLLVKDARTLRDTYRVVPDYLADLDADENEINFYDHGIQLTRSFRALKLWMSLKTFGADSFRAAVDGAFRRAERLAGRIVAEPGWRVETGPQLATLTFRYTGGSPGGEGGTEALNEVNRAIADHTMASNRIGLHTTAVHGRTVLRICMINPRTTAQDEDALLDVLREAVRAVVPAERQGA
ncbi:pyridoxal phosphate-dependent decarboxylase family protein [Streptomyces gobiensis]|uniref:pyridoxal phosphate-dependent decarboxylase family protein n=1 Tax=Streptomyces gobiensis TaxID=2875706 RepID=UPI001E49D031|nr:pyridoxal-dependent decarboxylase [Streptomyces gobiensis]UGY93855.1 L-2,4-diaminobutyrate decarboxylase [Streptomyces gobiensis]